MISKSIIVGWTLLTFYSLFSGLVDLQASGVSEAAFGFAATIILIVNFFQWCMVALPTYMISRMFSRRGRNHGYEPADMHHHPGRPRPGSVR